MFEFILAKKLRECGRKIKNAKKAKAHAEIIILKGSLAKLKQELDSALRELQKYEKTIVACENNEQIKHVTKKVHEINKEYGSKKYIEAYIKKMSIALLEIEKKKIIL